MYLQILHEAFLYVNNYDHGTAMNLWNCTGECNKESVLVEIMHRDGSLNCIIIDL